MTTLAPSPAPPVYRSGHCLSGHHGSCKRDYRPDGGALCTDAWHIREQLLELLAAHGRLDASGCACGWAPGGTYAEHLADVLGPAVHRASEYEWAARRAAAAAVGEVL